MHLALKQATCSAITVGGEVCTHPTHLLPYSAEQNYPSSVEFPYILDFASDGLDCYTYSQVLKYPLHSTKPFWEYIIARIAFAGRSWVISPSLPPLNDSHLHFADMMIASLGQGLFGCHPIVPWHEARTSQEPFRTRDTGGRQ